jgi:ligand-binding sensor domain-containing protein
VSLRGLSGVLVGAGLAALLGIGLLRLVAHLATPPPPPGWITLRPPHEVTTLALLDDVVWAGGRDGLLALDRSTGRPHPGLVAGLVASRVTALLVDAAGRLWAAHYEGLSRFAGGAWVSVARRGRELDARPVCLLEHEGALLVGTESGLGFWRAGRFVALEVPEGLAAAGVDVLHRDPEGVL